MMSQDVLADGHIALEEIGHGWRGDAQQRVGHGLNQLVRGGDGGGVLAKEHRAIGGEVVIVDAVAGVEVHCAGAVIEFAVGDAGFLVPVHRVAIVAALDVDMRRHVHQMAHVRGNLAQPVSGEQRGLRVRRHFHQVDMEVEQAGMVHRAGQVAEGGFEDVAGFQRAGAWRGFAGAQVPHLPRGAVEDCLDKDAAYVEVVGMGLVGAAHGIGEGVVPGALVVDGLALGVAGG